MALLLTADSYLSSTLGRLTEREAQPVFHASTLASSVQVLGGLRHLAGMRQTEAAQAARRVLCGQGSKLVQALCMVLRLEINGSGCPYLDSNLSASMLSFVSTAANSLALDAGVAVSRQLPHTQRCLLLSVLNSAVAGRLCWWVPQARRGELCGILEGLRQRVTDAAPAHPAAAAATRIALQARIPHGASSRCRGGAARPLLSSGEPACCSLLGLQAQ
jgi:hypothetical protein